MDTQAEGSGETVQDEPAAGVCTGATPDLEMTASVLGARRHNQRANRASARPWMWLVVVLALGFTVPPPLVWAAPEGQDNEESVPDAVGAYPDEQQLEMIVCDRYPQLVTQRTSGVPVVTELFDRAGTLVATDLEISAKDPGELSGPRTRFLRFGLKAQDLRYMGVARFELPFTTVVIVYGGRRS